MGDDKLWRTALAVRLTAPLEQPLTGIRKERSGWRESRLKRESPTPEAKSCPAPRRLSEVWGGVLFVTLLFFLSFLTRNLFSPLMPTIREELGFGPTAAGLIFLLGSLGSFVGALVSGVFSAHLHHRGTLLVALFLSALALLAGYFASALWFIQVVMIVLGFSAGLTQPSVTATVAAMVSREDWGKALSIQTSGPRVAYAAAPLLAVGLLAVFSWQLALVAVGALVALCGAAFALFADAGRFAGTLPRFRPVANMARTRSFWLMILLFSLGIGAQAGLYSMMPLYLTEERNLPAATANTVLGLASIIPIFAALASGWLTDRWGEKKTLFSFLFLAGGAAVLVGSLPGVAAAVCVFVLAAFSGSFFPPAFTALSRIVQPNLRSLAAAFIPPTGFLVGGGVLPLLLGRMGEAYTFGLGIVITGVVVMAGSLLVFAVRLLDILEEGC